jgi:hypothetical protein
MEKIEENIIKEDLLNSQKMLNMRFSQLKNSSILNALPEVRSID